ncbi:molybdopterin-guanine dinucleotide biosynthesis protein B [Bacillus sp. V3B]|uniref:molybdopterin-guanine dinucleotide biosynthesis protein B n=1 Tax=Bacillus sp. V3B TaxID=2804915 RepID=UPI002108E6B8|nr:molybdopterin-guanine dinucleotide biosynthesis protein B [Bacillus sp. V3B]MCQ6274333.1 molybdopterin-guanine dinucleotide biosynthesis protein B [Bacillus sp. V3B]
MVKPFVFQIVGYQNSGKTTFMNTLLAQLKLKGLKVVTIKHHGHGGKPTVSKEKDSASHIRAGAVASLVEGGGRLILQVENMDWSLEDKLRFISELKPDLIIVEGHKYERYPKLVFIRNEDDQHLLHELDRIELILYQEPLEADENVQSFQRNDQKAVQWLMNYFHDQMEN